MACTTRREVFSSARALSTCDFREEGIIEGDRQDIRMAFRYECAGNVRGSAASESNPLAQWQLREARNDLGFGEAFELRGGGGREGELYKIHEVDVAQQAQTGEARSTRMKKQRALDGIAFQEILA